MKRIAFYLIIASLAMTACRKDRFEPNAPKSMEDLQVPANFDWKTTKDYQMTFNATQGGLVQVTDGKNAVYQRAFLTAQESYVMKLTLPAFEKSVKVNFAGKETVVNLTGANLVVNLN
ncbi:MAG TPA: hypothetical protein PKE03_08185 [Bacteroidales bacterium]|nr:hypothetical protein [Bacteroidales bacterium]